MPILGEPGGCPCCTAELNKELKPRGSVQALHTLFLSSSNVPSLIYNQEYQPADLSRLFSSETMLGVVLG